MATHWKELRARLLLELGRNRRPQTCLDLYKITTINVLADSHSDVARALSQLYRQDKSNVARVPAGTNQPHVTYAYLLNMPAHDAAQDPIPHLDHEPVYEKPPVAEKPAQAALPLAMKKPAIRIKGQPDALDIRHKDNGSIEIETPAFAILIEA